MDQIQEIEAFIEGRWSLPALTLERTTVKRPSFTSSFPFPILFYLFIIIIFHYLMTPLYTAYIPLYANI